MYLYYTVIQGDEVAQDKPRFSLGGFKSSSRVVNSQVGNLFSDITNTTLSSYNQNQYIGLVLKNETGAIRTGVQMWFEYPAKCYSKLRIAAVDMAADANGLLQMEHIQTVNEKPLMSEFFEADGTTNKVDIGTMAISEKIGIWIERELLLDIISADQAVIYEADPVNLGRYIEVPLGKEDEIKIGISWD